MLRAGPRCAGGLWGAAGAPHFPTVAPETPGELDLERVPAREIVCRLGAWGRPGPGPSCGGVRSCPLPSTATKHFAHCELPFQLLILLPELGRDRENDGGERRL